MLANYNGAANTVWTGDVDCFCGHVFSPFFFLFFFSFFYCGQVIIASCSLRVLVCTVLCTCEVFLTRARVILPVILD